MRSVARDRTSTPVSALPRRLGFRSEEAKGSGSLEYLRHRREGNRRRAVRYSSRGVPPIMRPVSRTERPEGIRMAKRTPIAVTKTAAPEQIREALQLGVADLGESRVQMLAQRAGQVNEFHQRRVAH